ncbi:hypothetical protein BS47DRAFT_1342138 [Hydnum rufescens UP504]|uniref:Protein kinase domain-containing protein n=1 Tax=Hydnum rufescens UP504 TaxID=1448309 RepID=A0A9P6DYS5_9AGAM|nr:hypothetical protein BS47DRAFT_1342138 [Hydnum rufescens UP504]
MDGHAALCDFGLSVILDSGPTGFTSSVIGGTLRFVAPERLTEDSGFRSLPSDVYSYATTYAQIMTGNFPFMWHDTTAAATASIIDAIGRGEFPYRIGTILSRHDLEFLRLSWDPKPTCRDPSPPCGALGLLPLPRI